MKKKLHSIAWANVQVFKACCLLMGKVAGITIDSALEGSSCIQKCLETAGYFDQSRSLGLAINEVYFLGRFLEFPKKEAEAING